MLHLCEIRIVDWRRHRNRNTRAQARASMSASSASGVADRQAAGLALAQHGRRLGGSRQVGARRAVRPQDAGRGAARSATDRARGARPCASAWARGSSSGPSMTIEPPRSSMSALIRVSGLPPSPSGAPETARMRLSAASRQRGSSVRCQKADEHLGEEADARRRRAVMRLARTRARHVGGVARR